MPSLGAPELILVLIIVFLLFGAKKLPEIARSIGKSSKEFKKGMAEGGDDEASPETKSEPSSPPNENKNN